MGGEDGGYDARGPWCNAAGRLVRADTGDRSSVWIGEVETGAESAVNEAD